MGRFELGYRDPQQPDETFAQYQQRSENAYRALVELHRTEAEPEEETRDSSG